MQAAARLALRQSFDAPWTEESYGKVELWVSEEKQCE